MLGTNPQTNGCPVTAIEQNEAVSIPVSPSPDAITIYSVGSWVSQANGNQPDLRQGFSLGSINGYSAVTGGGTAYAPEPSVVAEKNVEPTSLPYNPSSTTQVQGVINLYNFINSNSFEYEAAIDYAGPGSPLCTNKEKTTIAKYGFVGLSKCLYVASK